MLKRIILSLFIINIIFLTNSCFKKPTDPFIGKGGNNGDSKKIPVNLSDDYTNNIYLKFSQVNSQGIYVVVLNQDREALPAEYFISANFKVNYNGVVITSAALIKETANTLGQSIATSLVLDYSDSMASEKDNLEIAAKTFVNNMQRRDRCEIIKFGSKVYVEQEYTSDRNLLLEAITGNTSANGSTALYDAIYKGVENTRLEVGQRAVIAFTDGEENKSEKYKNLEELMAAVREVGIPIYTIGLGTGIEKSALKAISLQTRGEEYYAQDAKELSDIYQKISNIFINTMILSWEDFNYTPGEKISLEANYFCENGSFSDSLEDITLY